MPADPDPKMPKTADLPRLLNITQVAESLGVEARHVRRLVHERRIPFIKWGHLLRFDPDEIGAWLDTHRQPGRPSHGEGWRSA